MALKFKCEKCGAEVVVRYPRPGEEALCPHCGAYVTVPETSVEAGEGPGPAKTRRHRAPELERRDLGEGRTPFFCPRCGGTNTRKELWSIWFGWSLPGLYQIVSCDDCDAAFNVKKPRAEAFVVIYFLIVAVAAAFYYFLISKNF